MTKMQIIAKTALTVLGIHAIVLLLRQADYIIPSFLWWQKALQYLLLISLMIIIGRILIFKNDSIARRITGPGEKLAPYKAASFLAASYRIALVFYGLICLSSSNYQLLAVLHSFNPISIRAWINHILYDGFRFADVCRDVANILPQLLIVILTIYFIAGAPHFVRFQTKRFLCRINQLKTEE